MKKFNMCFHFHCVPSEAMKLYQGASAQPLNFDSDSSRNNVKCFNVTAILVCVRLSHVNDDVPQSVFRES